MFDEELPYEDFPDPDNYISDPPAPPETITALEIVEETTATKKEKKTETQTENTETIVTTTSSMTTYTESNYTDHNDIIKNTGEQLSAELSKFIPLILGIAAIGIIKEIIINKTKTKKKNRNTRR